ncbi:MAG: substrate-binding domain-containing protein, partial [bacterium]|nr:substrate-binding domain-containing protein [bacterium]
ADSITLIVRRGPELLGHPAFSRVLRGVIEKTAESKLHLEFMFLEPDVMNREEIREKVSSINTSGVLIPLIPYMEEDHLKPLKEKNIPIVFINKRFASVSPYMVSYGLDRPVHQAVEDMLRRGRKKIALIGSPWDAIFGMIKKGADRALDEAGIKLKDEMVLRCPYSFESGRQAMEGLLKRGNLPDAVIAEDEYVAYGVLDAAVRSGISVSSDMELVAVGGFLEKVSMRPKLPTVRIPLFDVGFKATEILLDMIAGRTPVLEDIIVDSRFDRQMEAVSV